MQFWPPDYEHMCSKHVFEAWNKRIVKQQFCASSWLITENNTNCMFRLTSLPVDCCTTVFTDVTSLTSSPTLVTLLAKRTYISEDYCRYLSVKCYETDTEALWKCTGQVIRQTKNMTLPAVMCVEMNTTMEQAILLECDIAGAGIRSKVLVWNFSRWSVSRLQSCDVTPCSLADKASDPNRP